MRAFSSHTKLHPHKSMSKGHLDGKINKELPCAPLGNNCIWNVGTWKRKFWGGATCIFLQRVYPSAQSLRIPFSCHSDRSSILFLTKKPNSEGAAVKNLDWARSDCPMKLTEMLPWPSFFALCHYCFKWTGRVGDAGSQAYFALPVLGVAKRKEVAPRAVQVKGGVDLAREILHHLRGGHMYMLIHLWCLGKLRIGLEDRHPLLLLSLQAIFSVIMFGDFASSSTGEELLYLSFSSVFQSDQ